MEKIEKYIPYLILIGVCFFWFQSCENQKAKISDLKTEASLDSLDFKLQKDKFGKKVALQDKKIVMDRKTMKRLVSEVAGLRKINAQVKATVKTEFVNIYTLPEKEVVIKRIYLKDSASIENFMKLPQSFNYKSEWFKMKYSIDTLGKSLIDSAAFITKPIISFGYKDEGLIKNVFKKSVPVVTYKDENHFSNVEGLQNLEFKPKIKWYERKIVYFGAGIIGTFFILK